MIPFRNLLPPTNSQKTKPAYQAMNGRKQIVRGINGIKPDHGLIPESVCHNLRSGIGRRKQDKKTETDNPGYCICCKKAIYTLFFLSRNQNVIDSPKQITSKIDYQCPGYERDPFIGKYSFVKVCSGVLKGDDVLYNAEADAEEKPGKLYTMCGNKPTEVSELFAGDIGAIAKLGSTKTGDTLSTKNTPITYSRTDYSVPYTYMR